MKPALPAGSCDCHFHIFGPADRYPFNEPRSYTPPDAPLSQYLSLKEALGLDRCVYVQPSVYGTDNRLLLDVLDSLGTQARGIAAINERTTNDTLAALHRAGVRGTRINVLFESGTSLERLVSIAGRIAPLGWHVQLLMNVEQLPQWMDVIADLPVEVVFDHLGHAPLGTAAGAEGVRCMLELAAKGRAWIKISGLYRLTAEPLKNPLLQSLVAELAAAARQRLLWGSDWPHPCSPHPVPPTAELLYVLERWIPDSRARRAILAENPAELYGFDE